jgi:hypothetical protein
MRAFVRIGILAAGAILLFPLRAYVLALIAELDWMRYATTNC